MDHDRRCCARFDQSLDRGIDRGRDDSIDDGTAATPADTGHALEPALDRDDEIEQLSRIDWVEAQTELDRCDGYVVLAVDPQTGEVDAHGPFPGLDAVEIADDMRVTLDREGLDDIVVRVVRWHQDRTGDTAA